MDYEPKTRQEKKGKDKKKETRNIYSSKHVRMQEELLKKSREKGK